MIGLKIITNESLVDKVYYRRCRSKKKRIRNKWLRQEKNYRYIPKREGYRFGNTFVVHPETYRIMLSLMPYL